MGYLFIKRNNATLYTALRFFINQYNIVWGMGYSTLKPNKIFLCLPNEAVLIHYFYF